MRRLSAVLVAVTLTACQPGDPVGPSDTFISFQAEGVIVGSVVYQCGQWFNLPEGSPLVMDFFWASGGTPNAGPTVQDLDELRAAGLTVTHEFNVNGARASVPRSALASIHGGSSSSATVNHARFVPDTSRFDLELLIGHTAGVGDAIRARFVELGGHIESASTGRSAGIDQIHGYLPDASVPLIRSEFAADLAYVDHQQLVCGG